MNTTITAMPNSTGVIPIYLSEFMLNKNAAQEAVIGEKPGVENPAIVDEAIQPVVEQEIEVVKKKVIVTVRSFTELARQGENLPELKKVWGNNILEGNTVLFPAERGVGKTFLSLEIAIAVAEGYTSFLGEEIQMHGNTLYINMELSDYLISRRLAKLSRTITKKEGNPFQAYCISDRRSLPEIQSNIEKWIKQYKPVLVVIDNLRTAFSDSDNEKNKEMTQAITHLNELRDKYSFALVLVHHTKKGTSSQLTNSDMQSGAGAITDLVDGDFFLRRSQQDGNLRILKRAKSRNCEDQDGAKLLRLNTETLWFEAVQENVNESDHIFIPNSPAAELAEQKKEAAKLRADGKTIEQIAIEFDVNKSTVSRWLKV